MIGCFGTIVIGLLQILTNLFILLFLFVFLGMLGYALWELACAFGRVVRWTWRRM